MSSESNIKSPRTGSSSLALKDITSDKDARDLVLEESKSPRAAVAPSSEEASVLSLVEARGFRPKSIRASTASTSDEESEISSYDDLASSLDESQTEGSHHESHDSRDTPGDSNEDSTATTGEDRKKKSKKQSSSGTKKTKKRSKNRESVSASADEEANNNNNSLDFGTNFSKRQLRKLLRATMAPNEILFAEQQEMELNAGFVSPRDEESNEDNPPLPPPLPASQVSEPSTSTQSSPKASRRSVILPGGSLLEEDYQEDMPEKASKMLRSVDSSKRVVRTKSVAMMDKLLSKGNGSLAVAKGPRNIRYSSTFFAEYENFCSSPDLRGDPLVHLITVPEDDMTVVKETREDFQPILPEDRASIQKFCDQTSSNPTWLTESFKVFSLQQYRVVKWNYAEYGGSSMRVSESLAPGAYGYRVVPGFKPKSTGQTQSEIPVSTSSASPSSLKLDIPESLAAIKEDGSAVVTPRSSSKKSLPTQSTISSSPSLSNLQPSTSGAIKKGSRKKRILSTTVNGKDTSTTLHLSPLSPEFLTKEHELRQHTSKVHLFSHYNSHTKTLGINEITDFSRSHVPHPFEFVGFPMRTHTLIDCVSISAPELSPDEPLFCSLALHDVATRLKVSEDFCFELTSKEAMLQLDRSMAVAHGGVLMVPNSNSSKSSSNAAAFAANQQHNPPPDAQTMGNKCIITVTGDVHSSYYLILKVHRILLPEDKEKALFGISLLGGTGKKEKEANKEQVAGSLPAFFKQAYCWGAVPLGNSPSTLPSSITNFIPIKNAVTYEELYDLILNEKELKKIKTIPGALNISCQRVNIHENQDIQTKLLNASLEPFMIGKKADQAEEGSSKEASKETSKEKEKKSKKPKKSSKSSSTRSWKGFDSSCLELNKETGRSSVIKALQELGPQNRDFYLSPINHLYISPKRFTLKGGNSKEVQIEIRFKDSDHSPNHTDAGLKVFYGSSFSPKLQDVVVTHVSKDDKHIEFTDEFKLKLPYILGPQHHLLFTFFEVDSAKKYKRTLLGYSVLPILGPDYQLGIHDDYPTSLVVHPELPNHYMLSLTQQGTLGGKPTKSTAVTGEQKKRNFTLSTHLVSSVFSVDHTLSKFFMTYRRFPKKGDLTYDSLLEALPQLANVDKVTIFKHFPVIFNLLISLICSSVPPSKMDADSSDKEKEGIKSKDSGSQYDTVLGREAFVALLDLIPKVNGTTPGKFSIYLRAYLSYLFDNQFFNNSQDVFGVSQNQQDMSFPYSSSSRSLPFEALVHQIAALHSSGNNYLSGFEHNWFLLGLIIKSMCLYLEDHNLTKAPRMKRFSVDYISQLQTMLLSLLGEKNMRAGIDYTQGTALFLKDLLGLIDRGAVLTIVHDYLVMTRRGKSGPILETYKFALLKILGNYEHLSSLNIPLQPSGKELTTTELMSNYLQKLRERHSIAGELVHETSTHYIDAATAATLNGAVSPGAFAAGSAFSDASVPQESSFLPSSTKLPKAPLVRAGTLLGSIPAPQLLLELRNQSIICLRHVLAKHELDPRLQSLKAQQRVASMYFPYIIKLVSAPHILLEMTKSEKEEWLICFLYIVRNMKRRLLHRWFILESQKMQVNFWNVVEQCLSAFDKLTLSRQSDMLAIDLICSILTDFGDEFNVSISSSSGASNEQVNQTHPVLKKIVALIQTLISKAMIGMSGSKPHSSLPPSMNLAPMPSAGSGRSVSPLGGNIRPSSTSSLPSNRPVSHSTAAYIPVQDEATIAFLYTPMQLVLEKCPNALFSSSNTPGELFGSLLLDFLMQSNHQLSSTIRNFGASMLYILLKQANTVLNGDYTRIKIELAVAASKLIGTATSAKRRVYAPLLASLASIKKYAAEQHQLKYPNRLTSEQLANNSGQAKQASNNTQSPLSESELSSKLVFNIEDSLTHVTNLLDYSSKIEMNMKDPEMMQDLYLSIERGFIGSPELRVTWLDNLAQLHIDNEDYEEAAECKVQIASLVSQYLKSRESQVGVISRNLSPLWYQFPLVAPNLKLESEPGLDAAIGFESSNWHSRYLIDLLKQAAHLFDKATKYELAMEVFHNIRSYQKMEKKWGDILNVLAEEKELCDRLVDVNKPVERTYPIYFRVAFYGSKWENLDGKQFIYKKSQKFNLSTFKKQIEDQYRAKMTNLILKQQNGESGDYSYQLNDSLTSLSSSVTSTDASANSGPFSVKIPTSSTDPSSVSLPPIDHLPPSSKSASNLFVKKDQSNTSGNPSSASNATDEKDSKDQASSQAAPTSAANSSLVSLTYPSEGPPPDLVIMSTNEPVQRETLDPNKSYVQMTGVTPYFESEEADHRVAKADQHFGIDHFLFETPFSEDTGMTKETDDLSKQCKKKTIFRTTHCYPYLKTRLEIVETKEIVLKPIENAIELIKQQVVKVRGELEQFPTRLKSLQQVIQGSVVPMVNPGPLKICELFLSKEAVLSKKYSAKELKALCVAMNNFVKMCGFAIKLNKSYIDESHAKFQAMVEKFYGDLEKTVKSHTSQVESLLNQ